MANKGLKNYTKQLTHMIGNAGKANINLNYNDANIIFVLPLIKNFLISPYIHFLKFHNQISFETSFIFCVQIILSLLFLLVFGI